ncbi:hypothetical protein DFA_01748 [Cavenderia fasciculata]|uniref:Thioredoxin domain-containing protein n=1 Tax=Cavenderia fasciculata TaxID=261658 RepID=F4PUJ8_CACFS|nr:uncharacterized protein DFA_01748 [Cavenderia fasciculata]EGG21862.1 hypothetical protein DFA_01748 [Cavenderia fasciculata]|eukprot:XP_004359713.1 hypothetical protein DFA_01748 [Cavenderia fasciculata]
MEIIDQQQFEQVVFPATKSIIYISEKDNYLCSAIDPLFQNVVQNNPDITFIKVFKEDFKTYFGNIQPPSILLYEGGKESGRVDGQPIGKTSRGLAAFVDGEPLEQEQA